MSLRTKCLHKDESHSVKMNSARRAYAGQARMLKPYLVQAGKKSYSVSIYLLASTVIWSIIIIIGTECANSRAVVVAQLSKRSLPTQEVCGLHPAIGKLLYRTFIYWKYETKEKRGREVVFSMHWTADGVGWYSSRIKLTQFVRVSVTVWLTSCFTRNEESPIAEWIGLHFYPAASGSNYKHTIYALNTIDLILKPICH